MDRRSRLVLITVVLVMLVGAVLGGPAAAFAAPKKGSGGWYWPVGTENFHGWDGFWKFRPSDHSWHIAQDMPVAVGHAVYAIADGVIAESSPNSGYGGVLVVWHYTGDGQKFLTVYGHINRAKGMKKGVKVKAGQVIGHVNSLRHCHFGIHPGNKYPPDGNPYRGSTYDGHNDYGFVDPVKFLKTHPAQLTYVAPALPLVATIASTSTPTVLGTTAGCAYWTIGIGSATTTYTCPLPSGTTTKVADGAALPTLDSTRYLAKTTSTAFTLWDKLPVVSATYSTIYPEWARPVTVTGTVANAKGAVFAGAKVVLESSIDGGKKWAPLGTTLASQKGVYSFGFTQSRTSRIRVHFTPPATYLSATSADVTVSPKPGIHAPSATQPKAGAKVTIAGVMDARRPAGSQTVSLQVQKLTSGVWVDALTTLSTNSNSGAGSRYSAVVTLAAATYRVRAISTADSLFTAQTSVYKTFTVK